MLQVVAPVRMVLPPLALPQFSSRPAAWPQPPGPAPWPAAQVPWPRELSPRWPTEPARLQLWVLLLGAGSLGATGDAQAGDCLGGRLLGRRGGFRFGGFFLGRSGRGGSGRLRSSLLCMLGGLLSGSTLLRQRDRTAVERLEQQLRHVADVDAFASGGLLAVVDTVGDHHPAEWARRRHGGGAGGQRLVDTLVVDPLADVFFIHIRAPPAPQQKLRSA